MCLPTLKGGDIISEYFEKSEFEFSRFLLYSVENNTRKLNKICSSNLYPFSPESIVEHILATTNESRLGDKVSIFSQHFQDCIY